MGYKVIKTVKAQLWDVPIFGEHFHKIGRVIDLWADPCRPTPVVWVYAFWQAIPTFAASLTKPELIDINIEHRRGKPRKGKKSRMVADMIVRDALIEVPVPRWVPFTLYEFSQRIGWFFLVADATEQLAINWQSLAYRYNGCQSDLLAYIDASSTHVLQPASSGPGETVIFWTTDGVSQISWDSQHGHLLFPGKYRFQWFFEFAPYAIPSQSELPINTFLRVDGVPFEVGETSEAPGDKIYVSGGCIIDYDGGSPQPHFEVCASWALGTGFCYVTGKFDVSRVSDTELSPDP